jgi:uncharacterized membrane protein
MRTNAFFILSLALLVSFPFAASEKEYSIPSADISYKLNPDGTINARQQINYRFASGSFTELYIQLPPDLQISGASGFCAKKKCTFRTQMNEGWRELVLAGNFQSGESETATFDYIVSSEILSQKDASQFFYKLWGDQWQKPVGTLTATVEFPGRVTETQYFLHPSRVQYGASSQARTLTIVSKNHPARTFLELNAIMPKGWFSNLPQAKNYMTAAEIAEGEAKEAENAKFLALVRLLLTIVLFLAIPISFAACYFLFGRELPLGQLGYQAIYEHEPPGNLSPTEASKLIAKGNNSDCITSEILNFVRLKTLSLEQSTAKGFLGLGEEKTVTIRFLQNNTPEGAMPHQKAVYDFLLRFAENGAVTSKKLLESSSGRTHLSSFQSLESSLNSSFDKTRYMDMRGNNSFAIVCILVAIASFALAFLGIIGAEIFPIFICAVAGLVFNATKPQFLGRWTSEGRVLEAKWQNFYKFMTDQTLMKEKAPADIILWEEYLVYATAFGISDKVTAAFKVKFPTASEMGRSPMYSNVALAGALRSSMSTMSNSYRSAASSGHSSGGFGSGGGGGGGGGAR